MTDIFKYELIDGLQDKIEKESSIAFTCEILSKDIEIPTDPIQTMQSVAFLGLDNQDLYTLNSVLVSAGWNKNDDVFGVDELWNARYTPINKQFNYMHDDTDIIGHITDAILFDQEGNRIPETSAPDSLPQNIDIITSAVIYKTWSDPSMRERIAELIKEIEQGKWSVSMECVFNNFDYAIIGPDNNNRVLARCDDSSFLTKHLRAYGGTGEYHGYKIGRLLRGFYFSGKGLVNNPANPRSIIFNRDINPFDSKAKIEFKTFLSAMEVNNMADEVQQVEDFEAKVQALQAEFDAFKASAEADKSETETKIQAYETSLSEKDNHITTLSEKVSELEAAIAEMKTEKDKMYEENKDMKKTMKSMKRKASLAEAGIDAESSEKILAEFEEATDEMFATVVALMADKNKVAPAPAPAPAPPVAEVVETVEDEVEEEADASELDTVEKTSMASLANPSNDDEDEQRAIASSASWLRESVLRTTKNLK